MVERLWFQIDALTEDFGSIRCSDIQMEVLVCKFLFALRTLCF
jgi:hypothetical protein